MSLQKHTKLNIKIMCNSDERLSIIWNLTRACVWNCKFCCVSAKSQKNFERMNKNHDSNFKYENIELNFNEKIQIIDQLSKIDCRIDFSGGELLIDPLNIKIIEYASKTFGKDKIGISISGAFVDDYIIKTLKNSVNEVEITLDYIPFKPYLLRQVGYHEYAANAIQKCVANGIYVGAQTVLTTENIFKDRIDELFLWLINNNVNEWSLLRFFPVGRGSFLSKYEPTKQQYYECVNIYKRLVKIKI